MHKKNRLIVAAAGSGKTTYLVNEALGHKNGKILITTYTQANEEEIRKKIYRSIKYIPNHINIQTWFSFLLKHGVRPYQGLRYDKKITGLILQEGVSAIGVEESNTARHYFTKDGKIYSDKLSKFVVKCNEASDGEVINRISKIFTHIYIDELQDLASYDLDVLKLFLKSKTSILLVCDPRQKTYSTNNSPKNRKFNANIISYLKDKSIVIDIDDTSLSVNYRSCAEICELSNGVFQRV